ncbi:MAG: 50S ribosomal protein L9 [Acidobacteriota bacterium]
MARHIQVILLEDVSGLGRAGEIVRVAEGYARNDLFPEGKAALATQQVQENNQRKQAQQQQEESAQLEKLRQQAELLEGTELVLSAKVKEGNEIFGSIQPPDIVKKLNEATKLHLTAKVISLQQAIKELGVYPITVTLSPEVECTMYVSVIRDETEQLPDEEE